MQQKRKTTGTQFLVRSGGVALGLAWLGALAFGQPAAPRVDVERLVAALLGETPLVEDLRALSDEIGGRPTGAASNARAVEWALERFREAGVVARKEPFEMPALWLPRAARAAVGGDAVFEADVAALPFSTAVAAGTTAPLVDAGAGDDADFARLGERAGGAFVLIETEVLHDLDGLFREYAQATAIEQRAFAAGVAGVVYTSSRPNGRLYRHKASLGPRNRHPLLVMEREAALRCARLLRAGKALTLSPVIEVVTGGAYASHNVIGEIRGGERPDEVVIVGAHLDSWDLGTGALDNGCNVALVLDLARQIRALGLVPRRTIRFALWNGEEQGLVGSWGYVQSHAAELDGHVMAASFDIGSGRIAGFFTGGRPEVARATEAALEPVRGLGPFTQVDQPIVGTDNYDFMMEGVPNLVANQEPANYGPHYHAESDTFDKVDLRQVRLNAAVAAAVTWAFAQSEARAPRQSAAEVAGLVTGTALGDQMRSMGLFEDWQQGRRGRRP